MNNRLSTYLLYLSLGLNIALVAGYLYTSYADTSIRGSDSRVHQRAEEESKSDEWRAFKGQMTKLASKTRPLKGRIARKQEKLLENIMNQNPDGDTRAIRTTHNSIHELQRKLQDRTLNILLEENRKLSGQERRRVFGRLLKRHRHRYEELYSSDDEYEDDEDDIEEREEDDEDD